MNQIKRILIVEDDSIISLLLEKRLQREGYDVAAVVDTGDDAVNYIKNGSVGLVLMDIMLLGAMNGIEAMNQIRKFSNIPVIYMTGNSDASIRRRAMETDPIEYMIKPIDFLMLNKTISEIFVH